MSRYRAPDEAINHALGYTGPDAISEACRIAIIADLRDLLAELTPIRDKYEAAPVNAIDEQGMGAGVDWAMDHLIERIRQLEA